MDQISGFDYLLYPSGFQIQYPAGQINPKNIQNFIFSITIFPLQQSLDVRKKVYHFKVHESFVLFIKDGWEKKSANVVFYDYEAWTVH